MMTVLSESRKAPSNAAPPISTAATIAALVATLADRRDVGFNSGVRHGSDFLEDRFAEQPGGLEHQHQDGQHEHEDEAVGGVPLRQVLAQVV